MTEITLPKIEKVGSNLTIGYNGTTGTKNTIGLGTKTNPTLLGTVAEVFGDTGTAWDRFKNGQTNIINKEIADQNLALQQENLDYNKALNEEIFARADTAYQRQVADLRAAGLNPLMASGGAETGGSATPTTAPQNNYQHQDQGIWSTLQGIGQIMNEFQNWRVGNSIARKTEAEADSAKAQSQVDIATAIDKILQERGNTYEKKYQLDDLLREFDFNSRYQIHRNMPENIKNMMWLTGSPKEETNPWLWPNWKTGEWIGNNTNPIDIRRYQDAVTGELIKMGLDYGTKIFGDFGDISKIFNPKKAIKGGKK